MWPPFMREGFMDFSLLKTKPIINVLIGDVELHKGYKMPYMSGSDLCELSTRFGLQMTYTWGGQNMSRWMYMEQLLEYLNKQDRIHELLDYLFNLGRFKELNSLGDIDKVTETHKALVQSALNAINAELLIAKKELRLVNNRYVLANIGEKVVINTPKVNVVTQQYIRELPNRIKEDLANKDYDTAITYLKSALELEVVNNKQQVMKNLIIAYESSHNFKEAKAVMDNYLKEFPEDEDAKKEAKFLETR